MVCVGIRAQEQAHLAAAECGWWLQQKHRAQQLLPRVRSTEAAWDVLQMQGDPQQGLPATQLLKMHQAIQVDAACFAQLHVSLDVARAEQQQMQQQVAAAHAQLAELWAQKQRAEQKQLDLQRQATCLAAEVHTINCSNEQLASHLLLCREERVRALRQRHSLVGAVVSAQDDLDRDEAAAGCTDQGGDGVSAAEQQTPLHAAVDQPVPAAAQPGHAQPHHQQQPCKLQQRLRRAAAAASASLKAHLQCKAARQQPALAQQDAAAPGPQRPARRRLSKVFGAISRRGSVVAAGSASLAPAVSAAPCHPTSWVRKHLSGPAVMAALRAPLLADPFVGPQLMFVNLGSPAIIA